MRLQEAEHKHKEPPPFKGKPGQPPTREAPPPLNKNIRLAPREPSQPPNEPNPFDSMTSDSNEQWQTWQQHKETLERRHQDFTRRYWAGTQAWSEPSGKGKASHSWDTSSGKGKPSTSWEETSSSSSTKGKGKEKGDKGKGKDDKGKGKGKEEKGKYSAAETIAFKKQQAAAIKEKHESEGYRNHPH